MCHFKGDTVASNKQVHLKTSFTSVCIFLTLFFKPFSLETPFLPCPPPRLRPNGSSLKRCSTGECSYSPGHSVAGKRERRKPPPTTFLPFYQFKSICLPSVLDWSGYRGDGLLFYPDAKEQEGCSSVRGESVRLRGGGCESLCFNKYLTKKLGVPSQPLSCLFFRRGFLKVWHSAK